MRIGYLSISKETMVSSIRFMAALLAFGLLPGQTLAGQHSFGVGYGVLGDQDISFNTVVSSYGYQIDDHWGMDLAIQGYNTDDSYGGVVIELDYLASARVKGGLTTNGGHFFYLSGGYAYGSASYRYCFGGGLGCGSGDGNLDGATAGVGADFKVAENWGLEASYQRGFGDLDELNFYTGTVRYRF